MNPGFISCMTMLMTAWYNPKQYTGNTLDSKLFISTNIFLEEKEVVIVTETFSGKTETCCPVTVLGSDHVFIS